MRIQIISLFPNMFDGVLNTSMLKKAQDNKLVEFIYVNLRDFGLGTRKQVDDTPYGGGDGMLLRPEPIFAAIGHAKKQDKTAKVYLMTPRGKKLTQRLSKSISDLNTGMIIICPRYEGYDERIVDAIDEQISIGDYILTGGELPAMVLIDSIVRLIPGVLGGENSAEIESFSDGKTLEFPQYTRPEEFKGKTVPPVLLSGHHGNIEDWRKKHSSKVLD
ncbi:MAG TPA: tRNA (guanosine(37)-N1)-methyltransferase TrmD [Candidatus Saccharimonadales bacterium]|nr:tRNA (guanosine(37)-N1)-methyltransferase TrmD [Candidatus Saccharimonadales bacterium]